MGHMRIAPGKVVNGRVELDAELPEGTSVTVLALEGDETFEADAETEQILLQAIAQCEKGQTTPWPIWSRNSVAASEATASHRGQRPRSGTDSRRPGLVGVNRPQAPNAIREELERASLLISVQSEIGARARNISLAGVRRLHLARVRYHVYYRVVTDPERIEVLAFWHERRGSGPPL